MLLNSRITGSYVFKNFMARFKTTDLACTWHEAALPQAIIPYCTREFIFLQNPFGKWIFLSYCKWFRITVWCTVHLPLFLYHLTYYLPKQQYGLFFFLHYSKKGSSNYHLDDKSRQRSHFIWVRTHFANNEEIIYLQNFVDLVEFISRSNHIT